MISETHSNRTYSAILTDGVIRVFGPGINGAAEYSDNGESTLSDAIRYTIDKIVNYPIYIMKVTDGVYRTFNRLGDQIDEYRATSEQAIERARLDRLTAITLEQLHAL